MIELWKKEHFPYSRLEELYLVSYGLFVKYFQEYRVAKCCKSHEPGLCKNLQGLGKISN